MHIHTHIHTQSCMPKLCYEEHILYTCVSEINHSTVGFKKWLSLRKIKEFINGKKYQNDQGHSM